MPINRSLWRSLMDRYGLAKGKTIYFQMESERNPSFQKGLRTAIRKGHVLGLRKPRS